MKKQIIRFLSNVSPKMMTNLAYQTLTNPQVKKLREHELIVLDKADKNKVRFKKFDIQTYKWGNPEDEKILLIHGWEGQAGNFSDIIPRLLENNYHVIAFDGPAHGFSSTGQTSFFEFSELVGAMIREYGCKKLVSHSFGGVATTFALFNNQDVQIDKYMLLTTPDKLSQRIDDVANFVGVTEKVKNRLIRKVETEMNIDVKYFNVSNLVKEIKVGKSMIIHDKNDRVIPIAYSKNVYQNWPGCQFKEIEGTGHFRMLRTDEVIDAVVQFMN